MELKVVTSKTINLHAVQVAAVIAGRPVREDLKLDADTAFMAAESFFEERGVNDLESYLAHRSEVKAGLRVTAATIRELKKTIRPMDGYSQGYWEVRKDLALARSRFGELHDIRVLGKAWSAESRKRKDQAEELAA